MRIPLAARLFLLAAMGLAAAHADNIPLRSGLGQVTFVANDTSVAAGFGSSFEFKGVKFERDYENPKKITVGFSVSSLVNSLYRDGVFGKNKDAPVGQRGVDPNTAKVLHALPGWEYMDPNGSLDGARMLTQGVIDTLGLKSYDIEVDETGAYTEVVVESTMRKTLKDKEASDFIKKVYTKKAVRPLLFVFEAVQRLVSPGGALATVFAAVSDAKYPHEVKWTVEEGINVKYRVYKVALPNDAPERYTPSRLAELFTEWQTVLDADKHTDVPAFMHVKHAHTPIRSMVVVVKEVGDLDRETFVDMIARLEFVFGNEEDGNKLVWTDLDLLPKD